MAAFLESNLLLSLPWLALLCPVSDRCCVPRALNESKHRSGEDSQPKEIVEETAGTLPEEKEGIETMVVDYSHGGETAVSMVTADQPLLDTPEAKNE